MADFEFRCLRVTQEQGPEGTSLAVLQRTVMA